MEQLKLVHSTASELEELIKLSLQSELNEIRKDFSEISKSCEILSKQETAKFLKVDLSTLYRWTKKGKIKAYGIGNRVYYYMTDILGALVPIS